MDIIAFSLTIPKSAQRLPKHGEDVTRAGSIFASVDTSTKLTQGLKEVQVVATHKVLGQVDDGAHQGILMKEITEQRDCVASFVQTIVIARHLDLTVAETDQGCETLQCTS